MDPRLESAVRRAYDDFARGDFESALEHVHPDIVWRAYGTHDATVYRGHSGVRRFFEEFADAWESLQAEVQDVRDLGGGRILVLLRWHAKARASGVELQQDVGHLIEMREGLMVEMNGYMSRDQVLAALDEA